MEHFSPWHMACLITGIGLGIAAGIWCRNRLQIDAAPALGALLGAIAFWYAAPQIQTILVLACLGFVFVLAWKHQSALAPILITFVRWLGKPIIDRFHRQPPVSQQLARQQELFDEAAESLLSQPWSPQLKQRFLEDLERQHNLRIAEILDSSRRGKDDPHAG